MPEELVRVQHGEPRNIFVELLVVSENKEIEEKFKLKKFGLFFFHI